MQTTTNPHPDVPLPPGTASSDDWQSGPTYPSYRIINGADRGIDGTEVEVWTSATQFADGSIDTDDDPPAVRVRSSWEDGITAGQARQLARALIAAADEIDGWVVK